MITILLLTSNPKDYQTLNVDQEVEQITGVFKNTRFGSLFNIVVRTSVRHSDVQSLLLKNEPSIVHFCGHGSPDNIVVENETGESHLISADPLVELFQLFQPKVKCVVLNSCYSQFSAELISGYVDCVVGVSDQITDASAIDFVSSFYEALSLGYTVKKAFDLGRNQIKLANRPNSDALRIFAKDGVDLSKYRFVDLPQDSELSELFRREDLNDELSIVENQILQFVFQQQHEQQADAVEATDLVERFMSLTRPNIDDILEILEQMGYLEVERLSYNHSHSKVTPLAWLKYAHMYYDIDVQTDAISILSHVTSTRESVSAKSVFDSMDMSPIQLEMAVKLLESRELVTTGHEYGGEKSPINCFTYISSTVQGRREYTNLQRT